MNRSIRHRGPDDTGVYRDKDISLGNTRLAIIDLSKRGHQPMEDRSGRFVITFNGEIYNFKDLRKELIAKNYTFVSDTDTEVVINLYKEFGEKALQKLNGMFALAIWDKKEKKLLLARDRVGVKPLYYCIQGGKLFFSSEIKALFRHKIKKELNRDALDIYMRLLYVPAPLTIYENIHKVIPGQMLIWQKGKLRKKFYWELSEKRLKSNGQQTRERVRRLLSESVRRQLVADRPVGIFLSGGIDSTVVLGLATEIVSHPMKTFSIGFSDVPELEKFNADFHLARESARWFGADHHEYVISPQKALETFQKLIISMDEPISNPTHIPTFLLAEEARNHVVVVLGGDGGDELFGGYDRYLEAWILDQYQRVPETARKFSDLILKSIKKNASRDFLSHLEAKTLAEKYLVFMGQRESELKKIYKSEFKQALSSLSRLRGFQSKRRPFHEQLPVLDFFHWLPEESLMRTDKMTMLFGLEQRVPFLDNKLIDLAFQIPFAWKVGLRRRKKILREAFADILPDRIKYAPKRGFFSPGAKWLRHKEWQAYIHGQFTEKKIKASGVFNSKELHEMLNNHISGKRYNIHLLWAALTFQAWYQHNFK